MKIQCPACEAVYQFDEADLGREARRVKCAKCQEKFYIVNPRPLKPPPGREEHTPSPRETKQPRKELFNIKIPRLTREEPDPLKQSIGILGSVLLLVGVFLPFLRLPVIGLSNYFAFSRGDGIVLIVLAAVSLCFILSRIYTGTGYTGFFSAIILILVFYSYKTRLAEMQKLVEQYKALESMAETIFHPIQLEWGFAVMVIGAVLLLAVSAVRSSQTDRPGEEKKYITLPVTSRTALVGTFLTVVFLVVFIGVTRYSPFSERVQQQMIGEAVQGISAAQERYRDENHKFAEKTRDLYYIYVPDTALEVKMISADRFKWRASFQHKYGDKPVIYDSMGGMIEE